MTLHKKFNIQITEIECRLEMIILSVERKYGYNTLDGLTKCLNIIKSKNYNHFSSIHKKLSEVVYIILNAGYDNADEIIEKIDEIHKYLDDIMLHKTWGGGQQITIIAHAPF